MALQQASMHLPGRRRPVQQDHDPDRPMHIKHLIASLFCLAALASPWAHAATLEGQTFDSSVRLAGHDLRLNGLGLRAVLVIKGYVAGLYLSDKAASLQEMSALPGPKRLQLRMLRGAGPDDFNKALVHGIRRNASEAEQARLHDRIAQLEQKIQVIGNTVKGDVINLDYLPGQGTILAVNGAVKGPAIAGADFYDAVLGIFVGEHPVDGRLKKGLLGQ